MIGAQMAIDLLGSKTSRLGPSWLVPKDLDLVGDQLRWQWGNRAHLARAVPGMLGAFGQLAVAGDDAVLRFARRYGVLELCADHGLPIAHQPTIDRYGFSFLETDPEFPLAPVSHVRFRFVGRHEEPVTGWRSYAADALAVLRLATSVRYQQPVNPADRARLSAYVVEAEAPDQGLLAAAVNAWIRLGGVQPMLTWKRGPQAVLGSGSGLFGGLATALLLAVARGDATIPCSEPDCPNPGLPERAGARVFCEQHDTESNRSRWRQNAWRHRRRRSTGAEA